MSKDKIDEKEQEKLMEALIKSIKKLIATLFGNKNNENVKGAMNNFKASNPIESDLSERVTKMLEQMDKFTEKHGGKMTELYADKSFGEASELVDNTIIKDVEALMSTESLGDEVKGYPLRRSKEEQQKSVEAISQHLSDNSDLNFEGLVDSVFDLHKNELSSPPFSREEELGAPRMITKSDHDIKNNYDKEMNEDVGVDNDFGELNV